MLRAFILKFYKHVCSTFSIQLVVIKMSEIFQQ